MGEKSTNGVPFAVGTSMNQLSSSPLSFVRSLDASIFSLLLKMTFELKKAMARTASSKPSSSIADQASTSAFSSVVSFTSSVVTSVDLDLL